MTIIDPGPIPPVGPDDPVASAWGNAVASRAVNRYATTAERDAQGAPPSGALCWVAETRLVYIGDAGAWYPMAATFSAYVGQSHPVLSAVGASESTLATFALPGRSGDQLRLRVSARQLVTLSAAAAIGDQWELRYYLDASLHAVRRVSVPRAGAQEVQLALTYSRLVNYVGAMSFTTRLARLTGTATATAVADATMSRTDLEYGAGYPVHATLLPADPNGADR